MAAQQLTFAFKAPLAQRREVTYFAIVPGSEAAQSIAKFAARLRATHGLAGHPTSADRLHVSLNRLVPYHVDREADISAALKAGALIHAEPFDVTFDRVGRFGGRNLRPVVLWCSDGAAPLIALQRALALALMEVGLWPGTRRVFTPHMTLLYDRKHIAELALDEPIRLQVDEVVLIQSLVGRGRHIHRGRWPLRG